MSAPTAKPWEGEARPARRGLLARWRAEWWILGALLIVLPSLTLPPRGVWLGLKAFLLETAGVLLAVLVFSRGEWTAARVREALRQPINLAVLGFLVWVIVSATVSGFGGAARFETLRHLGGALVFFGVLYGVSPRRGLSRLLLLLGTAAALSAVFAFLNAREGDVLRVAGAFHNQQLLAGFLCLLAPLLLVGSQMEGNAARKMALQVALVIVVAGLLVTQNRSAWVGSLVGLAVLLACWNRWGRDPGTTVGRSQIIIPVVLVALALTTFLAMSRLSGSLSARAATVSALHRDQSFQWRLGMMQKAWQMALDRPLLGWGVGSFPIQQALYFHRDVPTRTQKEIAEKGPSLAENAHNTYLQTAAELGFPGLALYLGVLLAFATTALRALPRLRPGLRQGVLMASLAAVAAQAVSAVGSPAWEFAECSVFWWLTLGVGMACAGVGDAGRLSETSGGGAHSQAAPAGLPS